MTSVKIPDDVADEMEFVLKGSGTNFSQAVRLLALQTTALGGMPFAASIPPEGEMRGKRLPGRPWALFLGKAPCPLEHAEVGSVSMRMPREHGRRDVCWTNDSADRFAHKVIEPLLSRRRSVPDRASLLNRENEAT